MSLLEIKNLTVTFPTNKGPIDVVKKFNLKMGREKIGIVGESGSGKSMTARALLGLIRQPGKVSADKLELDGQSLLNLSDKGWRGIRGQGISMIMQDPKYSLNPVMTIKQQMLETWMLHHKGKKKEGLAAIISSLTDVAIRDHERVLSSYPHQLSGGMGQRIMIAMMLMSEPKILIADEATSALDVTVQRQILGILERNVQQHNSGLILISHDLPMVADFCDRIIVMYRGNIVEVLDAGELKNAKHPYTQGLLSCLPSYDNRHQVLPTLQRNPSWEKVS
ncbi:ABC transporter ATP-binding protein [Vibrio sp. SS-MA-C1-2]|uniref:ABC transporter ATP-binding protein n=1 Tax=Vibrio sp. SS-MA-C1-2 TaxID=2908646 RepID=UPI001F34E943|nr:ABC transporter ATP-binding protein [Vibrio sp. SS-MA-C1-2]UJF17802.1 ABC transporter ATP-binding protein [Vibrio sp. SS-MA-C1-2]